MLPIPCPLKYCLNIYSVDCHNTKKVWFESINYKYLHMYRNNHMKAENKPAIHSRCILVCMLCIEKQQQTTERKKERKKKKKPTNPTLQNLRKKKIPTNKLHPQETTSTKTNKNPCHTPKPVKDYKRTVTRTGLTSLQARKLNVCVHSLNLESSSCYHE